MLRHRLQLTHCVSENLRVINLKLHRKQANQIEHWFINFLFKVVFPVWQTNMKYTAQWLDRAMSNLIQTIVACRKFFHAPSILVVPGREGILVVCVLSLPRFYTTENNKNNLNIKLDDSQRNFKEDFALDSFSIIRQKFSYNQTFQTGSYFLYIHTYFLILQAKQLIHFQPIILDNVHKFSVYKYYIVQQNC